MELLKAGRELDLLVAEKVMSLVPCDNWRPINFGSAGGPAFQKDCEHENCYPASERGSAHGRMGGCPQYSTNITLAWQVVEHLRKQGLEFTIDSRGGDPYWAEFANENHTVGGQASADTPALAICLAALKARGVEVREVCQRYEELSFGSRSALTGHDYLG